MVMLITSYVVSRSCFQKTSEKSMRWLNKANKDFLSERIVIMCFPARSLVFLFHGSTMDAGRAHSQLNTRWYVPTNGTIPA